MRQAARPEAPAGARRGDRRSESAAGWTRPPGALPERDFLQACTGCADCLSACPHSAIRRLGESFVHKKMEQYRDWPKFLRDNPHVLASWPTALAMAGEAVLKVDNEEGAPGLEAQLLDIFNRRIGLLPFAPTAFQLRNALKLFGWGKTDKLMEYIARNW